MNRHTGGETVMAFQLFVSITGAKQGKFKGESSRERRKDWIAGLAFDYEVKSPHDIATGQHSGKRQHSPIRIVKEWGAATPQIFQAVVNNETIKEVHFEFVKTNKSGEEYVFHTIKLSDATISGVRQFTAGAPEGASSAKHTSTSEKEELEEVSFVFRKIEIENKDAKTMASDDWQSGAS